MTFAEALTPSGPANNGFIGPGDLPGRPTYRAALAGKTAPNTNVECAVCLYLALKQARRGTVFDPDTALSSKEIAPVGTTWPKMIVDSWGNPVCFYRWPAGSTVLNPSGAGPGISTSAMLPRDPDDPTGLLASPNWVKGYGNPFMQLCHPVAANATYTLVPVLASGGPDGATGLNLFDPDPSRGQMTVQNARQTADNLYSDNYQPYP